MQMLGATWGNENYLASSFSVPLDDTAARQFAQNCPRTDNAGIMWRINQRNTIGVSASPLMPQIKMRKFFNLRKQDRSWTPYGNVFPSAGVLNPTAGRPGYQGGQTAYTFDSVLNPGQCYPTDELYLTLFAASLPSPAVNLPLPIITVSVTLTYYVQFYDVEYQNEGDG